MLNCQTCEHNPTGERCELFGRVIGMHGCSSGVERKPRNNYERLKAMTMDELATFINGAESEHGKCLVGYTPKTNADKLRSMSDEELAEFLSVRMYAEIVHGWKSWLDWLIQEVTNDP